MTSPRELPTQARDHHRRAGTVPFMCELEDGERPIWHGPKLVTRCRPFHGVACGVRRSRVLYGSGRDEGTSAESQGVHLPSRSQTEAEDKIGRASCRERV